MRLLRKLILPTIIATPLWLVAWSIPLWGWQGFDSYNFHVTDFIWGFTLTALGLALIGIPASSLVSRLQIHPALKVVILLFVAATGGALVATLYMLVGGILIGSTFDADTATDLTGYAVLGVVPGLLVAVVAIVLNPDVVWRKLAVRNA